MEDLPKQVEINFVNPVIGYDTDNVAAKSQNPNAKRRVTHNLNVVMSAAHADAIAQRLGKAETTRCQLRRSRLNISIKPRTPIH